MSVPACAYRIATACVDMHVSFEYVPLRTAGFGIDILGALGTVNVA